MKNVAKVAVFLDMHIHTHDTDDTITLEPATNNQIDDHT